jgi:hypothetical protein
MLGTMEKFLEYKYMPQLCVFGKKDGVFQDSIYKWHARFTFLLL